MRAWQVRRHGSPSEALEHAEAPEPEPGPGELRVRVVAAAIGLPDVLMCRDAYAYKPQLPFVPGQEVCGVVDAIGADVDVPIGTRVMGVTSFFHGKGGFADATIVQAGNAHRWPDWVSPADAAGFRIGYTTAWAGLVRRGGLVAGESVLVLGAAGGSGATAVQLAHALGARVLAVAAGEQKLELCRRLGADVLIDRTREPVADAVLAATDGAGADLVYDPVGGAAANEAAGVLAREGRFLAIGFASGSWIEIPTSQLVRNNQSLVGVLATVPNRAEDEADHEALLELAADGKLRSFATVVPFSGVPDALETIGAGAAIGKYVVDVAEGLQGLHV